jgi:putative flippase GtrA
MWRLAVILFVIIAPTLMGSLILVAMVIPSLQNDLGHWIVISAVAGFVLSMPISFAVAKANQRRLA